MKLLKYFQFYCSSSKELRWPSIQAQHSLLSLSDIFSEAPSPSARVTELGAYTLFFFLPGPQLSCLFLRSSPAPATFSSPGLTCLAGQQGTRFKHPGIEKGMVLSSPAPWASAFMAQLLHRVGRISYSASSACILKGNTKFCFTFSNNWDRQPLSGKDLVFGWIGAAAGCHGKGILALERAKITWSQWA